MTPMLFCNTCKQTLSDENFYMSQNFEKYPNKGKVSECKKCFTRHVNNWDSETYVPLLEELDVPYIPDEWFKLLNTYGKNPEKVTGMTILGRYISKMRLSQFKNYRWKDTEHLLKVKQTEQEEAMKRQGFSASEIAEQLANGPVATVQPPPAPQTPPDAPQDYFASQLNLPPIEYDLTEEDMIHLTMSWGQTYKVHELVQLEKMYEDMLASYDVQTAGHLDTLRMICKTSLKSHQLIDMGDIEGFQKTTKVYDTLMRSGNFTAAQNKSANGDFVDSIGALVVLCETEGKIEKYYTDGPKDKVDETLADLKKYSHDLIASEPNLANLIEGAIKAMMLEENKEEEEDREDELTIENIDSIKDEEFAEMSDFLEEEEEIDEAFLSELVGEE